MQIPKSNNVKNSFDLITAKWWFIVLVPLIILFFPPYMQRNYSLTDFSKWYETIGVIAENNFTYFFDRYSVLMNSIAILFIVLVFILKNKFSRIFSIYLAILAIFHGITQNTSFTEQNGLGIILSSYIVFPILAGIWIWEAFVNKNNFETPPKINFWTISALSISLFAFWNPINQTTLMPDFKPVYFFANGGNSMFCTMTPLILAILFFFYPNVNFAVLRVTGVVGSTIGFIQVAQHLFMFTSTNWWIGVLHIPVFVLSLAALILSYKTNNKLGASSS
ncbi:hypothetical protein RBH29_11040 [Herbivorax sp. ANBcel31]|uniref:hypothetical protein n=1 Tax=Herbivorax sp. ANBcel31 TaxID=3069754 RepID=UPI0027B77DA1|nr:hypothetical protein [Herbivorax sp. ANBcel31]MDQ2086962.1 hypothetical protein [Herbivorax sp. ANBcel31]